MKPQFKHRYFGTFALVFVSACFLSFPAWQAVAQTITGASQPTVMHAGVDFTPLANQALSLLAVVLAGAVGVLTKFGISWLAAVTRVHDANMEAMLAAQVNDILMRSIDYGLAWSKAQVADPNSPLKNVEFNNFFVEQALGYAVRSMTGEGNHSLMNFFGLTRERIAEMIRARLDAFTGHPSADSGVITPIDAPTVPAA